jgi:glycosyltransferase involved in cell wall biosynthesis
LRIALVSPLYESVPPLLYGGTERVVFQLTEELVRQGHEVTLFASQDSHTSARLIAGCPQALRLDLHCVDPITHHLVMLEEVSRMSSEFDIIHFNVDYFHFPFSRRSSYAQITTLHGRLDIPDLVPLYGEYYDMPLISISNAQRKPLPQAKWMGTVYHGLAPQHFHFIDRHENYLAFLGRISPEKGVDQAIQIAVKAGLKLRIAAKIDKVDRPYFEDVIKPIIAEHPSSVEFIGEIGEVEKNGFLGGATALLFPIRWPEPFGLVLVESMACGTPIVAYAHGSVPEVIDHGKTGFIVDGIDEAVQAVRNISTISRLGCRQAFEKRFSAEQMAKGYLKIYDETIREKKQVD